MKHAVSGSLSRSADVQHVPIIVLNHTHVRVKGQKCDQVRDTDKTEKNVRATRCSVFILGLCFSVQVSNFHWFVIVHCKELPEPVHYTTATSFQQTCNTFPNWTVASFLAVCLELQRVDQVLAHSLPCSVRSKHFRFSGARAVLYDQDPVRSPPSTLAATSRTPPVTLLLPMPRRDPPNCSPQAGSKDNEGTRTMK